MSQLKFMMTIAILVAATPGQDTRVGYDRWSSWSAFGEGSSVTFESELMGRKYHRVLTMTKKTVDQITMRLREESPSDDARERDFSIGAKETFEKKEVYDELCKTCGKHKRGEIKEGKEKLKIGNAEYECTWIELTQLDCDGTKPTVNKAWYSKEVPGWVVKSVVSLFKKREAEPFATAEYACVSFVKK